MGEKLVTIANFRNVAEAHLVKGRLESEGIKAFLYDERATLYNINFAVGIRLVVKQSDAARASRIIAQAEQDDEVRRTSE